MPEKFKLSFAMDIAEKVKSELEPFCNKIEIAGSIRREKPLVKDIEIVCIPKRDIQSVLFKDDLNLISSVSQGFQKVVHQWEKVRGDSDGKYTQRVLPQGIKLDLFMAHEENWGLILAVRTGSAEFSRKGLGRTWCKLGYKSIDGMLHLRGKAIPIREEEYLFNLLGLPFIDPKFRTEDYFDFN